MVKRENGKGWVGPHRKGLWLKGVTMIKVTRGIQWGKAQIRVSEGVQVHKKIFVEK
jgi:hypothetical protein